MTDPQHSSPVTAGLPHRDFDKHPYSPDEQRVAEFIFERGGGGGDDPIGFILASYAYVVQERNELLAVFGQDGAEPVEAEIEAWIRTLDDEKDRNLVMWMERALRAEKELSEINGKLFANAQSSLNAAEDAIKRQQGIKPDADVLARDLVAAGECEYAQRALPQTLTGEIACILEDCGPAESQSPEALAELIRHYQPTWTRIVSALSSTEREMTPTEKRLVEKALRDSGKTIETLTSTVREGCPVCPIQRLRKAIQDYLDGNWGTRLPRKIDKCPHDRFGWEDCGNCIDEYFAGVLALTDEKTP